MFEREFFYGCFLLLALMCLGFACATKPQGNLAAPSEVSLRYVLYQAKDGHLKKMTSYPRGIRTKERQRYYLLPDEAERFLREVTPKDLPNDFSFRLFLTAAADAQWALLARRDAFAEQDHVSLHDFRNGSLDDLPFQVTAEAGISSAQWFSFIDRLEENSVVLSAFTFPVSWRIDDEFEFELVPESPFQKKDLPSALFVDGIFHGAIEVRDGVLRAVAPTDREDFHVFTVAVRRVAFADVDGDGFMDAIVRLSVNDWPVVAVLTRRTAEQRLFELLSLP